ncbi:DUF3053 family protein, partial [Pseudomonas syringae]
QRTAFTQFLQTRTVDKPGVHEPKLTDEEKTAIGEDTSNYAVISDYGAGMDTAEQPLAGLMQKGSCQSVSDVIQRRADLAAVQTGLDEVGEKLTSEQGKADAARAERKQPEDLKAVYDKAYDRTVRVPANAFREALPQTNGTSYSGLHVADTVDARTSPAHST